MIFSSKTQRMEALAVSFLFAGMEITTFELNIEQCDAK